MFMPQRNDFTDIEITDIQARRLDQARLGRSIQMRKLALATKDVASDAMNAGWYCLAVRTGFENVVEQSLIRCNVHVIVPKHKAQVFKRRGQLKLMEERPVIAGYVFVRVAPLLEAFEGLNSVDRVLGVLGGLERPFRIKDAHVQHFINMAEGGLFDHREIEFRFLVGDRVRVANGPFEGLTGSVKSVSKHKKRRVSVGFQLYGKLTCIELDVAMLEKL